MTTSLIKGLTRSTAEVHHSTHSISAQEFITIYDELFPRIFTYVRYRVDDLSTADDLTSDIFERALKFFESYQPSIAPFSAWIFAIARNEVNKHLRTQATEPCMDFERIQDQPAVDPTPEELLMEIESHQEVLEAIKTLSERERDLLGQKFSSRLTNRHIAEITGISESNVGVIVYRTLQKLRKMLTAV